MLKQIANEVWKKCMDEMSKDDNKQLLDNYIYKPVHNTISDLKMYFILLISIQIITSILILLLLIINFINNNNKIK
jgi:hypothetical protein